MITVVCVYKLERNSPYDLDYVHRLAYGVNRNLSLPFRFVCLTDASSASFDSRFVDEIRGFRLNLHGWWAKINVFDLKGPLLYLDLDTVIVGPLDSLVEDLTSIRGIVTLRNFYDPGMGSGLLAWGSEDLTRLSHLECWTDPEHVERPNRWGMKIGRRIYWGDQRWLQDHVCRGSIAHRFAQDLTSGIYSYKVDIRDKNLDRLPDDARIVCFHGQPRPHAVHSLPWMMKHWKMSLLHDLTLTLQNDGVAALEMT